MIHLDANFLMDSLKARSRASTLLQSWLSQQEALATSAIAWAEFANGPVRTSQVRYVEYLIKGDIVPFTKYEAEVSARLFNQTGRRRGSLPDCLIAATAIIAGARLATENKKDFRLFASAGLLLI